MTHRSLIWSGLLVIGAVIGLGCSAPRSSLGTNESVEKQGENALSLSVTPVRSLKDRSEWIEVAIVGLNDVHGTIFPKENVTGGMEVLASQLQVLKKEYQGRMLVVDAGDEWQGTLESNSGFGRPLIDLFHTVGVQAAAIGNHEFDFSLPRLKKNLLRAKYPYLSANIFEKKSGRPVSWSNLFPSKVFDIDGVKIGVIGYTTVSTPQTTRPDYVQELEFRENADDLSRLSQQLRQQGAKAIVLSAHAGGSCGKADLTHRFREGPEAQNRPCESPGEIGSLLSKVTPGTFDAVVAGHTHQIMHHWIHGVPVVSGEAYLKYFNVVVLPFRRTTQTLEKNRVAIEGPIPVLGPRFHGQVLPSVPTVKARVDRVYSQVKAVKERKLGRLDQAYANDRNHIDHPLNFWIADRIREEVQADVVIINSGGTRKGLPTGEITYGQVFEVCPFDNFIGVLDIKGSDLLRVLQLGVGEARRYVGWSGATLKLRPRADATYELISAQIWDGKQKVQPLDPHQTYRLATYDFIFAGGDQFGPVFQMGSAFHRAVSYHEKYPRDVIARAISQKKTRPLNRARFVMTP